MTTKEFLSSIQSRGATIIPAASKQDAIILNTNLQQMGAAMLPAFLMDLYNYCNGIYLGSAYIFGVTEVKRGIKYPIPSIAKINKDMIGNKNLFGKMIFGRNDLFWFAADALGNCFMLDNLTLSVLRKYDSPYQAMNDCLIVGKI